MAQNNNLKFRRQFLYSAVKCFNLENWIEEITGSYFLYVHPDNEFSKVITNNLRLYLIGFAINPHFPEKTSQQILEDISKFGSVNDIINFLYPLTGRFILLIEINDRILIFNDACGLKQVHYTIHKNKLFAASQPLLLQIVIPITKSQNAQTYFNSKFVKHDIEHFIPSGISLFDNVFHLVPNHYLDSEDFKQKRYWPSKELSSLTLEESIKMASTILKNSIYAANKRYKLALGLTAGRDSRILLSASKNYIDDIFVYTLNYRNLSKRKKKMQVLSNLSNKLGFKHYMLNCKNKVSNEFAKIYKGNSDMAHWNDWGIIANGMYQNYPDNRIALRGHCIEIARCDFYKLGIHMKIKSPKVFNKHYYGYNIDFIKKRIDEWYKEISFIEKFGYDIFDLFYWEHEMGSWQAQSLLEWDIIHETFAPYNNRELLDISLSVNTKYRSKPRYVFFNELTENLWYEAMTEPINPKSFKCFLKNYIKDVLNLVGIKTDINNLKQLLSKFKNSIFHL